MPNLTFDITDEPLVGFDASYTKEVLHAIEQAHENVYSDKIDIKKLRRFVERYPHIPQFRNYLVSGYRIKDQDNQAFRENDAALERFPNYLFAKITKAEEYIETGQLAKVKFMLGHALDLHALYPERQEFHITEVSTYYGVVIDFLCESGELEKAEEYLDLICEMLPGHAVCEYAEKKIMLKRMEINLARLQEERKNAREVEPDTYDQSIQTKESPDFHFFEIWELYEYGVHEIETASLQQLLLLPPDELIPDLETALLDSMRRFEYYREQRNNGHINFNQTEFPTHALFLLAELQAEQSLPVVLDFLRQGPEFLDFWIADLLTEAMWEVIYKLGQNQLPLLEAFLCERNRYTYAIAAVSSGLFELALHDSAKRQKVIEIYGRVLDYFFEHLEDDQLIDSETLGSIISDVTVLRADELLPQIERLFQQNVVASYVCGSLDSVRQDIKLPVDFTVKNEILSVFDRYGYFRKLFGPPEERYEEIDDLDWENEEWVEIQPVRTGDKIGRNDPCPCGSGKKYKKCCWGKDQPE